MTKANLTLLGASLSLNADKAKSVLADECQLPETDIDAACKALFELKKPFTLYKDVELAVAATHFGQLQAHGFDCEVEVAGNQGADDSSDSTVLRNRALAAVCVLSVAVGSGYFFYSQKDSQKYSQKHSQSISQSSPVAVNHSAQLPETVTIAAATELTEFHQWRNRLDEIASLKHEINQISSTRFQTKLVASAKDPLARTVGTNYITQLSIQRLESPRQDVRIQELHQKLKADLAAINTQPATLDRFYATLDLAVIFQRLQQHNAAQSAFELAENLVVSDELNQAASIVIARVALAEHQHLQGRTEYRDAHLDAAAATVDSGFEAIPGSSQEWAIAHIARVEAKFGLFAKAHSRLSAISDEQIADSVMVDITRYAASKDDEPKFELIDVTERDFSVDYHDMVISSEDTQ